MWASRGSLRTGCARVLDPVIPAPAIPGHGAYCGAAHHSNVAYAAMAAWYVFAHVATADTSPLESW